LALLVSDIVRQMVGFFGERFMDGTVPSHREPIVIRHSGVILIDEFDVHLHPMVARGLGPWLEKHFPNVQFIVTENGLPEDSSTPSYRLINLNQAGAVGQAGSTIGRRGVPRRRSPSKDNVS
jgi:predicted ATP-binding protein involved in virulence